MREHIYIDGNKVINDLPLRSIFYGEGVFETFRYKNKPPVLFSDHLSRMEMGASFLKIPCPTDDYIHNLVEKAVNDSKIDDAYVKICLLSSGNSLFYSNATSSQVLVIIKEYAANTASLRLTVNSVRTISHNPLRAIKSLNYLDNIIARREAQDLGFDESLFLNERGEVVECSASNIFWYKNGTLYTPGEKCGCLPGTTRNFILSPIMANQGIEIIPGGFTLDDLLASEFIFVTNSLMGCAQIVEIDGTKFSVDHEIFEMMQNSLYEKLEWS